MDIQGIRQRISLGIAKKGITQTQFLEDVKIPRRTFFRMMNGEREWHIEYLITLAEYFDVNLDYLIRGVKTDEFGAHVVKEDIYKLKQRIEELEVENMELKEKLTTIGGLAITKSNKKKR